MGYVTRRLADIIAAVGDPAKITLADVEASIVRCPDPRSGRKK